MNFSEMKSEGVWRNDSYKEEYEFLECTGLYALAVDHITVKCAYDENLSTSFQMRHVVDSKGNRGFMCYVSKEMLRIDTHQQGTTQEVYDQVKDMGISMQKEELRRTHLTLNRQ